MEIIRLITKTVKIKIQGLKRRWRWHQESRVIIKASQESVERIDQHLKELAQFRMRLSKKSHKRVVDRLAYLLRQRRKSLIKVIAVFSQS